MAEEPAIVFSVKELIGRLDGKLDMMMNVLTNKADRSDVNNLEQRVGRVEEKVNEMGKATGEHLAAEQTERKVKTEGRDNRRAVIIAIVSIITAGAAIATVIVMAFQAKGH